jgi:acetylornithine deacetylase
MTLEQSDPSEFLKNSDKAKVIREAVNSRKEEILEWAKSLIRFKSENRPPDGSEGEAQKFIEMECRKLGMDTDMFIPDEIPGIKDHPSWLQGRNYPPGRANVVGTWKGKGGGRSLLYSGHMDVAPFEPDIWKVCRPFEPVVKNGRLYGRGSADLKGGLAAAFWGLRILKDLGFETRGDILFESVVDEEFAGGNGTLASRLRGHNADLALLTEPTRMQVCTACQGAFLGDLVLTGKAGVPYMGHSIPNPITGASKAIELFSRWQEKWRSMNRHPLFEDPGKELNVLLWSVDTKNPAEFTQLGAPLFTKISWVVWCYPGMTEDEFYKIFREFWEEHARKDPALKPFKMDILPDYHFVRPWETDRDEPAVVSVVESFKDYTGKSPVTTGAPISCDLAVYGDEGRMPAVILGPRGDNLHAPDEWVLIEDILTLSGVFALLAGNWCGD